MAKDALKNNLVILTSFIFAGLEIINGGCLEFIGLFRKVST
jgi:hypothetical protein